MNKKYFQLLVCLSIMIAFLLILRKLMLYEGDNAKVVDNMTISKMLEEKYMKEIPKMSEEKKKFLSEMFEVRDTKKVSKIPKGFVSLTECNKLIGNFLSVNGAWWGGKIWFKFKDREKKRLANFHQIPIDSDYIVEYSSMFYINKEECMKLEKIATIAIEQSQRIYNLGDEIEVLGADDTIYNTKIISVEAIKTESFYFDNFTTYNIKYATTFNVVPENKLTSLIAWVETKYDEYDNLDFIDKETVSVKIKVRDKCDKIETIILRSPYYMGLTYEIAVPENTIEQRCYDWSNPCVYRKCNPLVKLPERLAGE
jgi:hypothetical protein